MDINQEKCCLERIRNCCNPDFIPFFQHKKKREYKDWNYVNRKRENKEKEISVISFADTIVHPRAMMIKILKGKKKNNNYTLKDK